MSTWTIAPIVPTIHMPSESGPETMYGSHLDERCVYAPSVPRSFQVFTFPVEAVL